METDKLLPGAALGVIIGQLVRAALPTASTSFLYDAAMGAAIAQILSEGSSENKPLLLPGQTPGAFIAPPPFNY